MNQSRDPEPLFAASALIDDDRDVEAAIKHLSAAKILAVDTEFFWERTYHPVLALVQVAGRVGEEEVAAYAFDPIRLSDKAMEQLDALLGEKSRLKVFHAGRIDLEILNADQPEPLSPVCDSQIAAALCGLGPQIGYANLVEALLGRKLGKAEQYADWTVRPLRPAQVDYALLDVVPLLDVHDKMMAQLESQGRVSWLDEELAHLIDPATYVPPRHDEKFLKIKGRRGMDRRTLGTLRELAAWREAAAEDRDLRPSFVVKDHVLVDIARRQPQDERELGRVRGLHGKELKRSGSAILKAVARAAKCPEKDLPSRYRREAKGKSVSAVVDLVRAYLHQQSDSLGVAVETLTTSKALEKLARDTKREEFAKDHPMLCGWRRELVGEDVLKILRGEVRLVVDPEGDDAPTIRLES